MVSLVLIALAANPAVHLRAAAALQSRPHEQLQSRQSGTEVVLAAAFGQDTAWLDATSALLQKQTQAALDPALITRQITALNTELLANKKGGGSGAEIFLGTFDGTTLNVSWVGAFGVIRVRNGQATRMTLPHTAIEDFIRTRRIPPEDREDLRLNAPHRAIVIRALGVKPELEVETERIPVKKGDRIIIAALGVLTSLPLELMATAVSRAKTPDEAANALVVPDAKTSGAPGAIVLFAD